MITEDYLGFFYKGHDGSILCTDWKDHGYELVSQPLTYNWMKREITKLYKRLRQHGFYSNASCGIHVHVTKKWFSDQKAKLVWKFVKALSEEDCIHFFGRSPNTYCSQNEYDDRYRSINTTNTHTNEFRMFKSGDEEWAQYCIDCSKYMVENAKHLNLDAFYAFRSMYK